MNIELMSPAGNMESLIAAIENGADSVYLGLNKFNARRPARNFTAYNLKKAVGIAHEKNKKIYLAMNIDLKSNELKDAVGMLTLADEIGIDAVIVKDPGLILIMKEFFSGIKIHLSTQCAIGSSLGVRFAKHLGVSRVILARELTIEEIKKAGSVGGMETEIFTEGSMCFSISGRCLMSSWVGSRSGNRGACMAPCRVLWNKNNKLENYFSMKDLSIIRYLDRIKETNIKTLKIEGRLKNALWVGKITAFYRQAMDNIDRLDNIKNFFDELKKHSAREISTGHIFGHDNLIGENKDWDKFEKTVSGHNSSDYKENNEINIDLTGEKIRVVIKIFEREFDLFLKFPESPKRAKPIPISRLIEFLKEEKIIIDNEFKLDFAAGDSLLSSSSIRRVNDEIISFIESVIRSEDSPPEPDTKIMEFINPKSRKITRRRLLGDFPDKIIISMAQVDKINNADLRIDTVVVSLEDESADMEKMKKLGDKYKMIISIPPVLYEEDAYKMNELFLRLRKAGFNDFEANSFTGMEILRSDNCIKRLGADYPVMNHVASDFFLKEGYESVYVSVESERSVYKSLSSFSYGQVDALVFGRIILFRSRVESPDFEDNAIFKDKFNIEIECMKLNETNVFASTKCFALIGDKIKNENIYFDSLTADLRYFKEPARVLSDLFADKIKNTATFNFYEKLI